MQENYFEGEIPQSIDEGKFGYGTSIRTFDQIDIKYDTEGVEVLLNIVLDSGFELTEAKLKLTNEDIAAYETKDINEAVQYALGFFVKNNDNSPLE